MIFNSLFKDFHRIEKSLLYLIVAEFFIQLVNCTFLNMQPLFMLAEQFTEEQIAEASAFRFLGVFLLAIPLGIYIRNHRMKPLFYISAFGVPAIGISNIIAIKLHLNSWICLTQFFWGISFTFIQISIIPYILRYAHRKNRTAAIALSYGTWSFAGIVSGSLIYLLNTINASYFNEQFALLLFSLLGFLAVPALIMAGKNATNSSSPEIQEEIGESSHKGYDWPLIIRALIPTLIIAVGAGLTIPFISVFFSTVHHMSTGTFSFISAVAAGLVAYSALMVPRIKRGIGYKIAIPGTQSLAVISLIALATTQLYAEAQIAVFIAIFFYWLRQPLMNMAGPMTSEMVMDYVGKKNREMVSALSSAIWSGSWFVSSLMVKIMRAHGLPYVYIFLITAALYAVGVVWYFMLILDYQKKRKNAISQKIKIKS